MSNYSYERRGGVHIERENIELCEFLHVHEDVVEEVKQHMPEEDKLYDLADFFKVFADSTRIKILYVLLMHEMCVCDLAGILGASQSAVSHQLRTLKQMDLVRSRREGKTVFYSLADDHIKSILSQGLEHIEE
ncbi:MAG: winged helix-turn-helix transcriptional regulator [Lachnospiraceae bacterium]|nr:winged helix-turn-helix transcriptional regulator [Lachnospiraceae bacterium]